MAALNFAAVKKMGLALPDVEEGTAQFVNKKAPRRRAAKRRTAR